MFISLGTNEFRTEAHGQGRKAEKYWEITVLVFIDKNRNIK